MEHGEKDIFFMQRCIELARKGRGFVQPNPMVGAVIVHQGQIIGEGYHRNYGGPHAEVHAIRSVQKNELLKESTIYVSLEPCAHFGKTPPCADLIVASGIPKVVIGMKDPFAKVDGLGILRLKQAGIEVIVGVMEEECRELNKEFICFHTQKRPYVVLKWAQTTDGFIDRDRDINSIQKPAWITHEVCRSLVHKWRTELQGILVGTNTALMDNPQLNVRSWTGKNPVRMVIDHDLSLQANLNLFDQSQPTLIFNSIKDSAEGNNSFIKVNFNLELSGQILHELWKRNITSLLVEGGQQLLQTFIDAGNWDEARVFTGIDSFGKGVAAPNFSGKLCFTENIKGNQLQVFKR